MMAMLHPILCHNKENLYRLGPIRSVPLHNVQAWGMLAHACIQQKSQVATQDRGLRNGQSVAVQKTYNVHFVHVHLCLVRVMIFTFKAGRWTFKHDRHLSPAL